MKKRMFLVVGIIVMLILVIGYTRYNKPFEIKKGKYIEQAEGFSWIVLKDNNQYVFNRGRVTSYRPKGTYTIKDGEIILTADGDSNEVYKFKIQYNKLVLENSIGELLKEGAVFEYTDTK